MLEALKFRLMKLRWTEIWVRDSSTLKFRGNDDGLAKIRTMAREQGYVRIGHDGRREE